MNADGLEEPTPEPGEPGGSSGVSPRNGVGQQPTSMSPPRRRRPLRSLWRWFVKRVDTIPPDPPRDAELPPRRRIRESWWPPLRILADHAHPVPWDPPANFPQPVALLQTRLATSNEALADELLSDAERLFDEATASVDSIERRATTLQGGVAIAATVALTGGGLVLDPTKIHGDGWRTALALSLAALVLMLAMTALRALGATSRLGTFRTVSDEDIFARARMSNVADAKTSRAGYLLHAYGRNAEVAQVKVCVSEEGRVLVPGRPPDARHRRGHGLHLRGSRRQHDHEAGHHDAAGPTGHRASRIRRFACQAVERPKSASLICRSSRANTSCKAFCGPASGRRDRIVARARVLSGRVARLPPGGWVGLVRGSCSAGASAARAGAERRRSSAAAPRGAAAQGDRRPDGRLAEDRARVALRPRGLEGPRAQAALPRDLRGPAAGPATGKGDTARRGAVRPASARTATSSASGRSARSRRHSVAGPTISADRRPPRRPPFPARGFPTGRSSESSAASTAR